MVLFHLNTKIAYNPSMATCFGLF